MSRLAIATDAGDWDAFLSCFAAGATADYGPLGSGLVTDLVETIRASQARYTGTTNLVTTHSAWRRAGSIESTTYVVSHHFCREDDGSWRDDCAATEYSDRFAECDGGPRIEHRVARLLWFRADRVEGGWLPVESGR